MTKTIKVRFVKYPESQSARVKPHKEVGVWATKPFQNWKKVIEKEHAGSETHVRYVEAELLARINHTSFIMRWNHERSKNRNL